MFLFLEIYGTLEQQREWHKNLRGPLMNLSDKGTISRFVLTYHFKPIHPKRARLYLSMDIPELTESTLDAFMNISSLRELSDYIAQLDSDAKIDVSDYEAQVQDTTDVENASRGSAAALKILKEGPKNLDSWKKLVEKVIDYCGPLDKGTISAIHFCFNSLGLNDSEEKAALKSYFNQPISDNLLHARETIIKNLFNREFWEFSKEQVSD